MKFIQIFILSLFALIAVNCGGSSFQYNFDFNEYYDFTQYGTYDFLRDTDTTGITVLNKENILLIENEIADRILDIGMFQKLDDPDLIIYYEASITGKKKSTAFTSKYKDIFNEGNTYVTSEYGTYKDREGTLTIYFYDLKQRQIVWKGATYGMLEDDQSENRENVLEAINRIFDEYPVQKK